MELFEVVGILLKRIVWLIVLPLLVAGLTYVIVGNDATYTAKGYFRLSLDEHMTQYLTEELKNENLLKNYLMRSDVDSPYKGDRIDAYAASIAGSMKMVPVTQRKGRDVELEGFDLKVSSTGRDDARNRLRVFSDYAHEYLVWKKAVAVLDVRRAKAERKTVELRNEQLNARLKIENIDRQLEKFSKLTQEQSESGERMVMLSGETSASYLPIGSQITGLKSRRIDYEEKMRTTADRIELLNGEIEFLGALSSETSDKGFAAWNVESMTNAAMLTRKMNNPLMDALLQQSLFELVTILESYSRSIGLGTEDAIVIQTRRPATTKAALLAATMTFGLLCCWFVLLAAWKRWSAAERR